MRPHLEHTVLAPQYKKDYDILEQVKQRVSKRLKGPKHMMYEEGLAERTGFL